MDCVRGWIGNWGVILDWDPGTPGYWGITTLEIAMGGLSFSLIAIAGSQVAIG